MPDYKKLYYDLFNDVTDAIEALKKAQQEAEERYLTLCEQEAQGGSLPSDPAL